MLKGYVIREEFDLLSVYPTLLEWMEEQGEFDHQLRQIVMEPAEIVRQLQHRMEQREDLIFTDGQAVYYNAWTSRTSSLESTGWHLVLSDQQEYPFLHELKMLEGKLVLLPLQDSLVK